MKYRKKPIAIEAFEFIPSYDKSYPQWFNDAVSIGRVEIVRCGCDSCKENGRDEIIGCMIHTLEGTHKCREGDFVIKGVHGELYPCKNDIFHETYEEVNDNDTD